MPPEDPKFSVVPLTPHPIPTLEPPDYLSDEERLVWDDALTALRQHSTFTAAIGPLLETYVATVTMCRDVARELRRLPIGDRSWLKLVRQHCFLSRTALTTASKLRLTPRAPTRGGKHAA
jgi:hypothetical protein